MNLKNKVYTDLLNGAIQTLLEVKENIKDGSDCIWTYYENADQMRNEIDKYVLELEKGNTHCLEEIIVHFSATAAYQEHAKANAWHSKYLVLAERFDKIYERLKPFR